MKPKAAPAAATDQGRRREAIARAREEATDALVALQGDRARLDAESRRVAAQMVQRLPQELQLCMTDGIRSCLARRRNDGHRP